MADVAQAGPGARPWGALVVAVVAFATAGWLAVGSMDQAEVVGDAAHPVLEVAPGGEVSLASLPVEHRRLYEAAAADRGAFTAVTCYCGCEASLGHRHLLDCFERPEGGWERHATGCAVCLVQAEQVVEQRAAGTDLDDIVRDIDARFGAITAGT